MKIKITFTTKLVPIFFSLISGLQASAQQKEIRIFSASTVYANIFSKIQTDFEKKSGVKIKFVNDITKSSSAIDNLKAVLEDKAEAGVTSIPYEDWIELAKKENIQTKDANLTYRVIGKDVVEFITHPGVGTKTMKLMDIGRLYTGEVKNWKEVGGKDIPVVLFYQKDSVARNAVFKKKLMPGKEYSPTLVDVGDHKDLIKRVAETPGSIGYLATEQVTGKVQNIDTDEELMRPITMVSKGKPSDNMQKLVQYITGEGKALIDKPKK